MRDPASLDKTDEPLHFCIGTPGPDQPAKNVLFVTSETDRLPALAGIASPVENATGDNL